MRIHPRRFPRLNVKHHRKSSILVKFFLILLIAFLFIIFLDSKFSPIIRDYAYNRAIYLATVTINDAISAVITENEVKYNDLVTLLTDVNGNITALQTNALRINQLKADITNSVIKRLHALERSRLNVPVGSATGIDVLSGIGPKIRVSIMPLGTATANFSSAFFSAGINQTTHRILMKVIAEVTIVMPRESISTEVSAEVDVAETIIVGLVPDSYTNVEDNSDDSVSDRLFNYCN